ncbi:MAG: AAC(3) family N-acetyltransferase [Myxococcales bacterium]|nr:AAC(3) family N-acetyltransferase [Myxococcales bacterium]
MHPPMRSEELTKQLLALGVAPAGVLLVHTSFRRVRPVIAGPRGLLHALREALGPDGTLVMPTMTAGDGPFDPRTTPTLDMGITAETFWRTPGVLRSSHPGASFAASGPQAEHICRPQPLSPPHGPDSPVGRVHELDGQVLLLGVDHSESTTLHLAESLAAVPYSVQHPCIVGIGDDTREEWLAETDHCCEGFKRLNGWLDDSGLQREGRVGHATAKLSRARDLVRTALAELSRDPLVFLCAADAGCEECDLARASVGADA